MQCSPTVAPQMPHLGKQQQGCGKSGGRRGKPSPPRTQRVVSHAISEKKKPTLRRLKPAVNTSRLGRGTLCYPSGGQGSTWQCCQPTQGCRGAFADCLMQATPLPLREYRPLGKEERPGSEHRGWQARDRPPHRGPAPGQAGRKWPSSPGATPRQAWSLGQSGCSRCSDEIPQRA